MNCRCVCPPTTSDSVTAASARPGPRRVSRWSGSRHRDVASRGRTARRQAQRDRPGSKPITPAQSSARALQLAARPAASSGAGDPSSTATASRSLLPLIQCTDCGRALSSASDSLTSGPATRSPATTIASGSSESTSARTARSAGQIPVNVSQYGDAHQVNRRAVKRCHRTTPAGSCRWRPCRRRLGGLRTGLARASSTPGTCPGAR